MPSPFPGMDPYLEGDLWHDYHDTLAGAIRAQVAPLLGPHYVALLAKRYVLDRPSLGMFDVPPCTVYPGVHVVTTRDGPRTVPPGAGGAATLTTPSVEVPSYVEAP